jgi:hypothetical protein
MVGERAGLKLQLSVDLAHGGVDLERDAAARGVQLPADPQGLADEHGVVGLEPDLRVLGDLEEVGRSQVLIALGQLGVEAVGVDDELDGAPPVELERAAVAVEAGP